MIDVRKWNYDTKEYDPYTPEPGTYVLLTRDMDLPINCMSCAKDMVFGKGYTSKVFHTQVGFGYPVCEQCYEKEVETDAFYRRRREA